MTALPAEPAIAATEPRRLRSALLDIKLHHSVFALPFALLAVFLALPEGAPLDWRRLAGQLALVVACMVFARTWAMLVNRLADRRFDALNPRTARRALPSGAARPRDAVVLAVAAAGLFVVACGAFFVLYGNPWPLLLAIPTLAWIAFYSFTKRFTAFAHFFLGGALGASPLAAAIAVRPEALADTPSLWFLSAMVLLWVAGFDILYALPDRRYDRESNLRSVPARLGARGACWVSRALHGAAFGALIGAAVAEARFGYFFAGAVIAVGALLVLEHVVVARRGLSGLPLAFFTINGVVSLALGGAGVVDTLW